MTTYIQVAGFPGYRVGDDGTVSSSRGPSGAWQPLKPQARRGYPRVGLWLAGALHWRSVHTLVLTAFVGPRPEGQEACHRDNDRTNNALSNLRWDTPKGNQADSDHKRPRGSGHTDAKLSEADIPDIRRRVSAGESRRSVARSLGVSHTVINAVVRETAWKHAG